MKTNRRSALRRAGLCLASLCLAVPSIGHAATFAKGADVGWVSQEESSGYSFYSSAGVKTDPFVLLKALGTNAVRLRVWVNPSGGWCNGADVLYKAKRAAAQGMRIMIDFHYSDSWADPGQQTVPAAWAGHTVAQLNQDVYSHTQGILSYLKTNGITVTWVQVGNEINGGMLWPQGSTSHASQLAGFINNGYQATKAVYPSALVVLHLANGYYDAGFRTFFDSMKSAGAQWDVIGLSHYPSTSNWSSLNSQISTTMTDMVSRYGKPVIVSEVGMDWQSASTTSKMMADLISRVQSLGSNGLGVFYWEPEAYPGWQGYTLGAVDGSGHFTAALDPY
ncbi:MAG: glycosyl hydrolase 53 family protein [Betaproteobacteria bacterium]